MSDNRAHSTLLNKPSPAAGYPGASGTPKDRCELLRAPYSYHAAEPAEFGGADASGKGRGGEGELAWQILNPFQADGKTNRHRSDQCRLWLRDRADQFRAVVSGLWRGTAAAL